MCIFKGALIYTHVFHQKESVSFSWEGLTNSPERIQPSLTVGSPGSTLWVTGFHVKIQGKSSIFMLSMIELVAH